MKFWKKALLCVAGGVGTIVAAPVVIPVVASTGIGAAIVTAAAAAGTAVATASIIRKKR